MKVHLAETELLTTPIWTDEFNLADKCPLKQWKLWQGGTHSIFNVYILNSPDFLPQFQYLENLKDCTHLSLIHFNWKRNDHQGQVPRKMVKFNQVLSQILSMVFSSKNIQLEVTILLSLYYEIL